MNTSILNLFKDNRQVPYKITQYLKKQITFQNLLDSIDVHTQFTIDKNKYSIYMLLDTPGSILDVNSLTISEVCVLLKKLTIKEQGHFLNKIDNEMLKKLFTSDNDPAIHFYPYLGLVQYLSPEKMELYLENYIPPIEYLIDLSKTNEENNINIIKCIAIVASKQKPSNYDELLKEYIEYAKRENLAYELYIICNYYAIPDSKIGSIKEIFYKNPQVKIGDNYYLIDYIFKKEMTNLENMLSTASSEDINNIYCALVHTLTDNILTEEEQKKIISGQTFNKDVDSSSLIYIILQYNDCKIMENFDSLSMKMQSKIASYIEYLDDASFISLIGKINLNTFLDIICVINMVRVKRIYELIMEDNQVNSYFMNLPNAKEKINIMNDYIFNFRKLSKMDQSIERICQFFNKIGIIVSKENIYRMMSIVTKERFKELYSEEKHEKSCGISDSQSNLIVLKYNPNIIKVMMTLFHELIHHYSNNIIDKDKNRRVTTGLRNTTNTGLNESLTEYISKILFPFPGTLYDIGVHAIHRLKTAGIINDSKLIYSYFHNDDTYLKNTIESLGFDFKTFCEKFRFIAERNDKDYEKKSTELYCCINELIDANINKLKQTDNRYIPSSGESTLKGTGGSLK